MLGTLHRAVGAQSLRHLDDHGCVPAACPHHYHLPGDAGRAAPALHYPHTTDNRITCSKEHRPITTHEAGVKCSVNMTTIVH